MTFCNQSGAEALRYFYGLIPMLVPSQRSHWDVANVLQWHREIRLRPDPSASKHGNMALMRFLAAAQIACVNRHRFGAAA